MRKSTGEPRLQELKQLIVECEERLEVSELEKMFSELAYLLSLYIEKFPELETDFAVIGVVPRTISDLTPDQIDWMASKAHAMKLKHRTKLLFWMWRSWLNDSDYGSGPVRNASEWEALPEDIKLRRIETVVELNRLGEELLHLATRLPSAAHDAITALEGMLGSPLAVLDAAAVLLGEQLKAIAEFKGRVQEAYGFGQNHRPNKRFDTEAKRNIRAFFLWKHDPGSDGFVAPFIKPDLLRPQAKTAAIKAAHRFATRLMQYDRKLEKLAANYEIPDEYRQRRLP